MIAPPGEASICGVWEIATTAEFDEWFESLTKLEQIEVIAKVRLLELIGPRLGRPHADTLKGSKHTNMKELRATTGRSVLRIGFAFDPGRAGILLVGGNKAGVAQNRFYRQLITRADAIYDEHLAKLANLNKRKGT